MEREEKYKFYYYLGQSKTSSGGVLISYKKFYFSLLFDHTLVNILKINF